MLLFVCWESTRLTQQSVAQGFVAVKTILAAARAVYILYSLLGADSNVVVV